MQILYASSSETLQPLLPVLLKGDGWVALAGPAPVSPEGIPSCPLQ